MFAERLTGNLDPPLLAVAPAHGAFDLPEGTIYPALHRLEERLQSYLDQLLLALRGGPGEVRRLLAEAEAHLRTRSMVGFVIVAAWWLSHSERPRPAGSPSRLAAVRTRTAPASCRRCRSTRGPR